jgi:hypothetical protein
VIQRREARKDISGKIQRSGHDDLSRVPPRDLERTSDGFFIKLSYLFRL